MVKTRGKSPPRSRTVCCARHALCAATHNGACKQCLSLVARIRRRSQPLHRGLKEIKHRSGRILQEICKEKTKRQKEELRRSGRVRFSDTKRSRRELGEEHLGDNARNGSRPKTIFQGVIERPVACPRKGGPFERDCCSCLFCTVPHISVSLSFLSPRDMRVAYEEG